MDLIFDRLVMPEQSDIVEPRWFAPFQGFPLMMVCAVVLLENILILARSKPAGETPALRPCPFRRALVQEGIEALAKIVAHVAR
jgi:hypothetical protein